MDEGRFDAPIRSADGGPSRRGILQRGVRGLAAAVLAAIASRGGDEGAARGRKKARKKKKQKPRPGSSTTCRALGQVCANTCCAGLSCGHNDDSDPAPRCCADAGGSCDTHDDCCDRAVGHCDHDGTCRLTCAFPCPGAERCCDPATTPVCARSRVPESSDGACQAGGCPVTDQCNAATAYACGPGCECATSVDGNSVCRDSTAWCTVCDGDNHPDESADEFCAQEHGDGSVCLRHGPSCRTGNGPTCDGLPSFCTNPSATCG